MKRKAFSILIAVVIFISVVPLAHATPTNSTPYNNMPVHGGASQCMGTKTCTDKIFFGYEITSLNLNGQSKISFRPYLGGCTSQVKLLSYTADVTTTTFGVVYKQYDMNTYYLHVGGNVSLKASIPSTNTSVESYFSGYSYF